MQDKCNLERFEKAQENKALFLDDAISLADPDEAVFEGIWQ